jgi:hypothetical protein
MTDTPRPEAAQAGASNKPRRRFYFPSPAADSPERIAARARRIRLERAFVLIARTKCSVSVALRATGLDHDRDAREDVCDLLDRKGISRIRRGVRRVRFKETPSRVFEEFIPRQETPNNHFSLREMVAGFRAIADPLGPSDAQKDVRTPDIFSKKQKPIATCTCGATFEGRAKFCGVRCRVADWRAWQMKDDERVRTNNFEPTSCGTTMAHIDDRTKEKPAILTSRALISLPISKRTE